MSETIADKLVQIAENEVKLYEKTFGNGHRQGYTKGYKEGYDDGLAMSKPEDLGDVLNEQEEKIATLSAILDKKASGGGSNNFSEFFEGKITDVYCYNLESLQDNSFDNKDITSFYFPRLKVIGNYAFRMCYDLEDVTIPDGCTTIGDYAFNACTNLRNITIPNSVTHIGQYAFSTMSSLKHVVIPDSVTKLNSGVFYGCTLLKSIELPNTLTEIGSLAFYNCNDLTTINIPGSVTIIGTSAFAKCTALEIHKLPESIQMIMSEAFTGSRLMITHIPASLIRTGLDAFKDCTLLQTITFEGTPTALSKSTFSGCTNLKDIYVPWAEGEVSASSAPWGAENATIHYSTPINN